MTQGLISDFLAWYLAPWRRISRWEFGVALMVATVPGLLLSLIGLGNSVGSFIEPFMGLFSAGQSLQSAVGNGDISSLSHSLGTFSALAMPAAPAPTSHGIDWSSFINTVLLLATVPLCRMRLRDMGYKGHSEIALTGILNISVLNNLIVILTGWHLLPLETLFGVCNFAGYIWLCAAKSKPRAPRPPPTPDHSPESDLPHDTPPFPPPHPVQPSVLRDPANAD